MEISKIEKFIDKQKVSFICSVDGEGFPNAKAMLKPRKRVGLKEFYFSTNTSSMRVKQYQDNPNACIYFYHKGVIKYVGVMLIGKMEVLTDPDYCVLRFTAVKGRYYCDLKTESFEV